MGSIIGKKLQGVTGKISGLSLVHLENPIFERKFVVYSGDQQEARYILSPKLMERILNAKKMLRADISLSFHDNHLYIAIPKYKNFYEPSFFGSVMDYREISEIYDLIKLVEEIVNELELNTRIWSKK